MRMRPFCRIRFLRDRKANFLFVCSFTIYDILAVGKKCRAKLVNELMPLSLSEARVFLLYSTTEEAQEILAAAAELGMTSKNYMWIAARSVIGKRKAAIEFPPGMLGRLAS